MAGQNGPYNLPDTRATFVRFGEDLTNFQSQYASRTASKACSKLKIAHTVGFYPQALTVNADRDYAFVGRTRRL